MRDLDRIFRPQPNYRIPGIFLDLEHGKNAIRPQSIKQVHISPEFDLAITKTDTFNTYVRIKEEEDEIRDAEASYNAMVASGRRTSYRR